MALFTLPLSAANSHKHSASSRGAQSKIAIPPRKRKRSPQSSSADSPSQDSADEESPSDSESYFTAASTNPLSLAPSEILQYRLAGLELHEQLPKTRDFPHRAVPTPKDSRGRRNRKTKGKFLEKSKGEAVWSDSETGGEDEGVDDKHERGPGLRIQHLGVLTAILHKCLMEDDIPRASRAWALLVRTEVGGRAIDLRSTGYWTIGAYLLSKGGDADQHGSNPLNAENESGHKDPEEVPSGTDREFGTKEGREKAKTFFEQLILQYPYKRQYRRHGNLSALEIWPMMVTWEIYGIQFEQKQSLKRITDTASNEYESDSNESSEGNTSEAESRTSSEGEALRNTRRRRRREEKLWKQREEVRQTTLSAAEQLAARLDTLMVNVPYSDDHTMLEIRAHLALYVGDLSIPEIPAADESSSDEDMEDEPRNNRSPRHKTLDAEHRLQLRARLHNHEVGKRRRENELDRAKALVTKIRRSGGKIDYFENIELDEDVIELGVPVR